MRQHHDPDDLHDQDLDRDDEDEFGRPVYQGHRANRTGA
jgi:hypothetical protein